MAISAVAALGVVLTLAGFVVLRHQLRAHRMLDFEWTAHNRSAAIQQGAQDSLRAVQTVGSLVQAAGAAEPDDLADFVRSATEARPWIGGLRWLPDPPAPPGGAGGSGAGPTGPEVDQARRRAHESGRAAVSAPLPSDSGERQTCAVVAVVPVAEAGVVVAVIDVGELAHSVISRLEPRGVEVLVRDVTVPGQERVLAFYASRLSPQPDGCVAASWHPSGPTTTATFEVADRTWSVTSAATPLFRSAEAFDAGPWVLLAGGLLFTLLLTGFLLRSSQARALQAQAIRSSHLASLGVLAAGTAHEINNPNNAIRFNASLLRRVWADLGPILDRAARDADDLSLGGLTLPEAREAGPQLLDEVVANSERIKRITSNLKHLGKPDVGGLDQPVDLADALETAVTILRNQIDRSTDRFEVHAEPDLPTTLGNRQQLEQILINLILNALTALTDRSQAVRVSLRSSSPGGGLVVQVQDEGCGIPAQLLDRITEPFVTTRADSGGLGLGLAICRSIVEAHRGTLEFCSTPREGTSATVTLPPAAPDGDGP